MTSLDNLNSTEKYLDKLLNPEKENIDYNYCLKDLIRIKNMFLERCCFKIGDKVKLTRDLKDELEEKKNGWYSYRHFLNPDNTGIVRDITFYDNHVQYDILWDTQFEIRDNGEKFVYPYNYLFSMHERDLVKVDD